MVTPATSYSMVLFLPKDGSTFGVIATTSIGSLMGSSTSGWILVDAHKVSWPIDFEDKHKFRITVVHALWTNTTFVAIATL
jgi:hypothetical protein